MTDTVGNFTPLEDGVARVPQRMETKAIDGQGIEALKDIAFGSVCTTTSSAPKLRLSTLDVRQLAL